MLARRNPTTMQQPAMLARRITLPHPAAASNAGTLPTSQAAAFFACLWVHRITGHSCLSCAWLLRGSPKSVFGSSPPYGYVFPCGFSSLSCPWMAPVLQHVKKYVVTMCTWFMLSPVLFPQAWGCIPSCLQSPWIALVLQQVKKNTVNIRIWLISALVLFSHAWRCLHPCLQSWCGLLHPWIALVLQQVKKNTVNICIWLISTLVLFSRAWCCIHPCLQPWWSRELFHHWMARVLQQTAIFLSTHWNHVQKFEHSLTLFTVRVSWFFSLHWL